MILGGVVIMYPILMQAPEYISSGNSNDVLPLVFGLIILLTIALNIVR